VAEVEPPGVRRTAKGGIVGLRPSATAALVAILACVSGVAGNARESFADGGGTRGSRITYIYRNDLSARDAFETMLENHGHTVSTVHLDDVAAYSFDQTDLIIIGGDTDNSSPWGTAAAVANITDSGLPVIGISQGGTYFFSEVGLFIGHEHTMGVSYNHGIVVENPGHDLWSVPEHVTIPPDNMVELYTSGSYANIVYIGSGMPYDVTCVGRPWNKPDHCGLTLEDWDGRFTALWSWEGSPASMSDDAEALFRNLVVYDTLLFADGFESGTTYYWDATMP
jgi:hypothetical protein